MNLTYRPIKVRPDNWTGRHTASPFSAPFAATTDLLDRELRALGSQRAFIQVDIDEAGIRNDGMVRAAAKARYPGVILTVETRKHGTLTYPCDRFRTWQENLRAIALGLEALRKIERYGIAERGQQYAGFGELGSGTPMESGVMDADEAASFLARMADGDWTPDVFFNETGTIGAAYRSAARQHHPDAGGDPDTFRRITEARDLLLAG